MDKPTVLICDEENGEHSSKFVGALKENLPKLNCKDFYIPCKETENHIIIAVVRYTHPRIEEDLEQIRQYFQMNNVKDLSRVIVNFICINGPDEELLCTIKKIINSRRFNFANILWMDFINSSLTTNSFIGRVSLKSVNKEAVREIMSCAHSGKKRTQRLPPYGTENIKDGPDEQIGMETVIKTCINEISEKNIQDPIQMLRLIQEIITTGRKLDIDEKDIATGNPITGETNFIVVDRHRLIQTTFENISVIDNLRLTLEVQFYEQISEDYGGLRKEFFALVLPQIYEKYFDTLKEDLDKDYETVGKIFALSMLQNGKLPRIFSKDMLKELMKENPSGPILYLQKGMDSLGLIKIAHKHRKLLQLLTPEPLTLKMLTILLKPKFSKSGSKERDIESAVYQKFIKYLRDVTAERRDDLTLGNILRFVTTLDEEPASGFPVSPSIEFAERPSFLPTSNTSINKLILSVPSDIRNMPEDQFLFEQFDNGFSSHTSV